MILLVLACRFGDAEAPSAGERVLPSAPEAQAAADGKAPARFNFEEVAFVARITGLGEPPGIWADLGYLGLFQVVQLEVTNPLNTVDPPSEVHVRVLPDLPYTCAPPCEPGVDPSLVGQEVLIRANYRAPRDYYSPRLDASGIQRNPTPEMIQKTLEAVAEENEYTRSLDASRQGLPAP